MRKLYRYEYDDFTYQLRVDEFNIIKETRCGVWIQKYSWSLTHKKFVNMHATKRFAWETKEEALKSFIARKTRQVEILENELNRAKSGLFLAQEQNNLNSVKAN